MKLAMLTAHFTDRCNFSDETVLTDVASEIGLDRAKAKEVLDDQRIAADVLQGRNLLDQSST